MTRTFLLINLGCAKNLVEGEHIAGMLMSRGMEPVDQIQAADYVIINTCGFIASASEESIDAILQAQADRGPKQKLIVAGCLVGRYGKKLVRSLPEVDIFIGPGEIPNFVSHLLSPPRNKLAISAPRSILDSKDPRALSTGPGWAYLRLADGCAHRCSFCTIPAIRGPLRSRSIKDVLTEAFDLAARGVVELNLIAQDLTSFGKDISGRSLLPELLDEMDAINELNWIRLIYMHPQGVDHLLLDSMQRCGKVLPYFDIPFQHTASRILSAMGRKQFRPEQMELIEEIRRRFPTATLRTTLLVGHPGEGPDEFAELEGFVEEVRFDHLGCFAFQPEAGTKSALSPAPNPEIAQTRLNMIMKRQQSISRQRLRNLRESEQEALILGPHPDSDLVWHGRMASQAPEVDGQVIITEGYAKPGSIAACRIVKTYDYDVEGRIIEKK